MKKFIEELRRRNVIKASLAYLVIAWVLLQVFEFLLPMLGAPEWLLPTFTLILAIGLPVWIIISWIYDITPEGIEKTAKVSENELVSQVTNKRLNIFIIVSLSIAVIVMGLKLSNVFTDSNGQYAIAIIPFDNIKVDDGNEWLSAGFTTDINSYLSKITSLHVIDPYSAGKYRDSEKNNLVIGEELGVSHLVKGSVRQIGSTLTITVYLIDAISDKTEWSESFQESFKENPLNIQQEVSQRIVQELKIKLNPKEEEGLDKYATNSIEAQRLFSEGLSFADLVGVENLDIYRFLFPGGYKNLAISDSLFRQALALDPNYAEAMAELAFVLQLRWEKASKKWTDVKFKEIDSLIDRSLEINPNTVRAYTTRGLRQGYNVGNWEKAGEYFKQAIDIKPNDASNQLYYALYFALRADPDYIKALEHINIAQKLNPHSSTINYDKIIYLLKNDKIVEAEAFYKHNNSFFTESLKSKIQIKLLIAKAKKLSLDNKDWTEAIRFYHEEIEKEPKNAEIYRLLAEAYDEILNDAPNFLKYAEKAFYLDTVHYFYKRSYGFALLRNKKFEEGLDFLERYRKGHRAPLFTLYYFEGDYKKAQIYLDLFFADSYSVGVNMFAQQNKIKETYEILNRNVLKNYQKARVFAILEERDSMYYYINKEKDIYKIRYFNSYFEVDPYRKEERFKALLRKHYLPLTHWNE